MSTPKSGSYRFKGRNSLGYQNGRPYALEIYGTLRYPVVIRRQHRSVISGPGVCPYDSVEAFWANWESLSEEDK